MGSVVPSILMWVGEENYTLDEYIKEAQAMGVSKRVPITGVPTGLVQGVSKVFLAHPKAIIRTRKGHYGDLAFTLKQMGYLSDSDWEKLIDLEKPYWQYEVLQPFDFVPDGMLIVASAISRTNKDDFQEIVGAFDPEFCPGVIGYSPFGGFQYVLKPGETDLPQELSHLSGYVEPVIVKYAEDEEND